MSERSVGPGGDQEGVEHLEETGLQGAEEGIHQGRIIKMEGIFAVMSLEEIPVEESGGARRHGGMKALQLI